ncbi:NAD(P)H-dependent oxidoreductase [Bdellovibrio sp. SKB1291214]|uniref:NADPH-dependent FMN reductase n=1 Tax=Bdellovibrio sp. SKB1291214 TaxID=1732569 RepID=UPI000B518757|nr:NADPH-dependent FMN reductase [Bdellovibrio sp. SKB1291214]UYL08139.1 NAD(P)H-dependent oxidoreductase [Bdellovibrio sp. SKB1291214]
MKYIIAGTDRPDSKTLKLAEYVQRLYKEQGEAVEIIDLKDVKAHLHTGPHYGKEHSGLQPYLDKLVASEGLIVICPEYNGSMPGALKYFIDHMKFPETFEYRPVCFIGLGWMFGGLRPVEHLQQIFGYRNAFIFPERIFITNAPKVLDDQGEPQDEMIKKLLVKQITGFRNFVSALSAFKLDANSLIASKK